MIAGVTAVIGNTLAIIVLLQPALRTKTNKLLTSLVVSDLLMSYVVFPMDLFIYFDGRSVEECNSCHFFISYGIAVMTLMGSSAVTIAFIALDRYYLITKYENYETIVTNMAVNGAILIAWFFPFITEMIWYAFLDSSSFVVHLILPYLPIFLSLIAMVTIYVRLMKKINEEQNQNSLQGNSISSPSLAQKRLHKRQLKIARNIGSLILCFILCLVYPAVVDTIYATGKFNNEASFKVLDLFKTIFLVSNSSINPMIYAFQYPSFRKSIKKLFCRKRFRMEAYEKQQD